LERDNCQRFSFFAIYGGSAGEQQPTNEPKLYPVMKPPLFSPYAHRFLSLKTIQGCKNAFIMPLYSQFITKSNTI
jgi:hypothetical protein